VRRIVETYQIIRFCERYCLKCGRTLVNSTQAQCRKFNTPSPCKDDILGRLVYPFKLEILALPSITVRLVPKEHIWCRTSHLAAGDSLQGETIEEGELVRPLGKTEVKPATAKHKVSFLSTCGLSFVRIEIGIRALLQRNAINDRFPLLLFSCVLVSSLGAAPPPGPVARRLSNFPDPALNGVRI